MKRGLTQEQLAVAVGVSPNTIGTIENRKNAVSLATAAAIAIYLGLPAETLLIP